MRSVRWWAKRTHAAIFGGPWPRTADDWWRGAAETNAIVKNSLCDAARALGASELVAEMEADEGKFFDTVTYSQRLNEVRSGAGTKAVRDGIEAARRHRLDRM